jgi:hypothetical protein
MALLSDKLAIWLLRLASTCLSLFIVFAIFSKLPEDDNPFDGYAVIIALYIWSAFWAACAVTGWIVGKYTKFEVRMLSSITWFLFSIFALRLATLDLELNSPSNIIFWLETALIISVPIVFGWAWAKKPVQKMDTLS